MCIGIMNIIRIHQENISFFQLITHIIDRRRNLAPKHINDLQMLMPVCRKQLIPGIYICEMNFSQMIIQDVFIFCFHVQPHLPFPLSQFPNCHPQPRNIDKNITLMFQFQNQNTPVILHNNI